MVTQAHGPSRKQSPLIPLSLPQETGFAVGVAYAFVGMLGFAIGVGRWGFYGDGGNKVFKLFKVNAVHNVVHLSVAALLIGGMLAGYAASRAVNGLIGFLFFGLGIAGFFMINTSWNVLALNEWDNVLHLLTGLVLLGSAGAPPPRRRVETGFPDKATAAHAR